MASLPREAGDRKYEGLAGLYHVSQILLVVRCGRVTVGEEQLLWDKAVAKRTPIDGCVVKVSYVAEVFAGLARGAVVRDLITDRLVQHRTADLAWAADGDAVFGNRKHASCEGVAKRHWTLFSALPSSMEDDFDQKENKEAYAVPILRPSHSCLCPPPCCSIDMPRIAGTTDPAGGIDSRHRGRRRRLRGHRRRRRRMRRATRRQIEGRWW